MFQQRARKTRLQSAISMAELIFHSTAHNIRKSHNNAILSIVNNLIRVAIMLAVFYGMFAILGLRRTAIRGDFLLFMLSGIFLYMTHVKTVTAVMGADGPSSPMMQHAPMNTLISLASSALSTLYLQVLTLFLILFIYHVAVKPFDIYDPSGAFLCIMVAWFYGIAVGVCFLALRPWFPEFTAIGAQLYTRANMIASGKMFVANQITPAMRNIFDWNPLYHSIDQARGYTFINYNPHFSSLEYAITVAIAIFCLGMIGEFYTRRRASKSWNARR